MLPLSWIAPVLLQLLLTTMQLFTSPFLDDLGPTLVSAPVRAPDKIGRVSRYGGPKDSRWGGQALACAPDYYVTEDMHVCAHRTLPCGTLLVIQSMATERTTICRVVDRGPFGAIDENGVWFPKVGKHRHRPGVFRGELDLSYGAFYKLGLKGLGRSRIWKLWVPAKQLKIRPRRKSRTVDT